MRVLTWNLWWRFGPWQERQPAIAAELRRVDPDIALLQEVWAGNGSDQLDELAAGTGLQYARTTADDGTAQEFGNAIMSRWPLEILETRCLPSPSGLASHRTVMACRVASPIGSLVVVVTHLAWQYDQSLLRQRQLAVVAEVVANHRDDDPEAPPVIVGGDFNAVPESDEMRRLTGLSEPYVPAMVLTDCWAAVGRGPGHTWTRDNPYSAQAVWPRRRLDYVFVTWPRPKPLGNPLAAELIGRDPHRGVVPSDHYGVLVELDDRTEGREQ